jgi:hypothetical protein
VYFDCGIPVQRHLPAQGGGRIIGEVEGVWIKRGEGCGRG